MLPKQSVMFDSPGVPAHNGVDADLPFAAAEQGNIQCDAGAFCSFAICRVSGMPATSLDAFQAWDTWQALQNLTEANGQVAELRDQITNSLYDIIGQTTDRNERNRLVRLRRAVYHLDKQSIAAARDTLPFLSKPLADKVRRLQSSIAHKEETAEEFRRIYAADALSLRHTLQNTLSRSELQNGVLLSSVSLFNAIKKYLTIDPANINGKGEKTERGILRYFTRATAKATPFSTFCTVIPAAFQSAAMNGCEFVGDLAAKRSYCRLNKSLYGILAGHLRERTPVRDRLTVELNPTVRNRKGKITFLAAVNGRETFQRMDPNAVLNLIASTLEANASLPFGRLIANVAEDPAVDADPESAREYLDKMIEIGLLRFRSGIPAQTVKWDVPLLEMLKGVEDEHAKCAARLLRKLNSCSGLYAEAETCKRAELLQEMSDACESAFQKMGIQGRIKKGLVLYEDTSADAALCIPVEPATHEVLNRLAELAEWTGRLAWPRTELAAMRCFFDRFYGTGVDRVPLLKYYEDYFREHFKNHLEKEREARRGRRPTDDYNLANPFCIDLVGKMQDAQRSLMELIRARWMERPDAEEIQLTAEDLQQTLGDIPSPGDHNRSLTFFATRIRPDDRWPDGALVVPGAAYLAGYGKYFSRFLYMLPDGVRAKLMADNETLTPFRLAEISGDAEFNANLHPKLLRWEIAYPTGESGQGLGQLRMSDLCVTRHATDSLALSLIHEPTGQRVIPIDLGFLNPRMRPPLYQMLLRFTPGANFTLLLPDHANRQPPTVPEANKIGSEGAADESALAADDPPEKNSNFLTAVPVRKRPRIVYEGAVVIARRTWFIQDEAFPTTQPKESPSDHFLRVNRWRVEHGIPEEVYVRIRPVRRQPPAVPLKAPTSAATTPTAKTTQPDDSAADEPSWSNSPPAVGSTKNHRTQPTKRDAGRPRTQPSRDLQKPQFIDFRNPLLVGLFGRPVFGAGINEYGMVHKIPRLAVGTYLAQRTHLFQWRPLFRYL
ncbi:MAG: lantibiotic dehydratase [Woeseiaceae bacterium]